MTLPWQQTTIASDTTHHLLRGEPLYEARFDEVLSFHPPGIAAARDVTGAFHIAPDGAPAYSRRFRRTFGFYDDRAAVEDDNEAWHIGLDGNDVGPNRFAWCGNFQAGRCTVRDPDGSYFHVNIEDEPAYRERWRYAGDFREGAAVVQDESGRHHHIDSSGRTIGTGGFLDLDVFHKGFARARDEGGWFHLTREGQPAYARRFAAIEPFYNGQARCEAFDGSLHVIDENGSDLLRLREATRSDLQELSGRIVGFWGSQAIRTAVETGVMDALPAPLEELAVRCRIPTSSLRRFTRALIQLGLVATNGDQVEATSTGRLLSARSHSGMREAALHWAEEHAEAWKHLTWSLRTGRSGFEQVYGRPFFDWLSERTDKVVQYQKAMRAYAAHDYAPLPNVVRLPQHATIIDAGGGSGLALQYMLEANPGCTGVLLDRPEVVADRSAPTGLEQRWQAVPGNLFEPWPAEADLVLLCRVLHDWDDPEALLILQRARDAMRPGGRIVVVEQVLGETGHGGLLDLNMLVVCGSREREQADWARLSTRAGLRLHDQQPLPTYGYVMQFERAP